MDPYARPPAKNEDDVNELATIDSPIEEKIHLVSYVTPEKRELTLVECLWGNSVHGK